ncbi:phosphatidylserine/phosphatidylglycerophosphate/cardiolipin synthase family protein [Desulfosporosinus sp. Sb-LF]|uniref:phospholipase D-like domain-containing protein n=1 Tax=Desulfosporosinus sp. Sb-LF TaxID=2560027 RepID=UPI00107F034B|nr:phosphatidylserine/phosphatidylglycerophosphate/cardiolipin synthase family protein [Desulfosporosinus sp. Sb-LF]TGE32382.1 phosphatidylserine/phosphatidylglycerophosphate/cardiolipin synthase family protein [Desulfosporosinus sp. Sb-LF]
MSKRKSFIAFLFLLLCSTLLLSGCTIKVPKLFPKVIPISNLPAEALFVDKDPIYNQTVTLIQSAQTSIYIEQAEFDDPRLIQLLLTKSHSGIDVRILLDQWQKVNRSTLDQLKSQDVSVQFYPAQKGQVNHTKYLIIDQNRAFIYGPPWTASGLQAHDLAVELSGKAAWKVASQFSKDWLFTTTLPLPVPKTSSLPEDNIVLAVNANVKQQLTDQITTSTKSIWIEIPEVTDPDLIQALTDAAEKGRDIRLITDRAVTSKIPVTIEKLKTKGVSIRYFPSNQTLSMHMAIFDNKLFLLTSSDWTHYSFIANHEFSITIPSPVASAKLGEIFKQDWEKSTE